MIDDIKPYSFCSTSFRLVSLGHKVGVVRQIETAALKSAGDNKNAPFTRKLVNLYTKGNERKILTKPCFHSFSLRKYRFLFLSIRLFFSGTFIDDTEAAVEEESLGGYLIALVEEVLDSNKSQISLVAINVSTGELLYDTFIDELMRSELEMRLLYLNPVEIILPFSGLSKLTDNLISSTVSRR